MALVGGAGNPVGGSTGSTGSSINFVGDHCYMHSGTIAVQTSETTMGKFAIQNAYVDSIIQFHYGVNASGDDVEYVIKINDEVVVKYFVNHSAQDSTPDNEIYLILPPHSTIEFTATAQGAGALDNSVTMRGRVYA
jgi:hypothetical protein